MRITLAQPARSVGLLFAGLAAGGVLMAGGMAVAADGSRATVELDEDFAITGEEAGGERGGHGRGGPGGHGRGGHGGHGGPGECDRDDATAPATTGEATTAS